MAVTTGIPTREEMESIAKEEMEKLFETVPMIKEFHAGQAIDREYYKRHLMETIIRIGLNNEVDSYCLYKIGYSDNKLAQLLSTYLAEEFGHDNLFLSDLEKFGVTREEVKNTPPLFSTQLLIGYMYYSIDKDGPMPTMVWNWFVEWYSDQYNMNIAKKAADEYGTEYVKGSMAHLGVDEHEDHVGLMYQTVERVMKTPEDGEKAKDYLRKFIHLISMYFQELHDTTIGQNA
ncbi:Iron-containing redox enzyme [Laceyella tengchongensis]|uniref:Iron-containing redox enzyme n=1 Tax=Laceyella tengchongensis TaxID=574699 RepID=A0AA46AG02_9BACL|nr:iron-containing redox enzyme family protein [Laceyella tengchongensis]SMP22741.1 Iron-containing redox enzyme [Laceyella tengchongensis]